jgi:hypothetical protein
MNVENWVPGGDVVELLHSDLSSREAAVRAAQGQPPL